MRAPIPLSRIDNVDHFYADYFLAEKPVVVTGAAKTMGAFTRWTDEYLLAMLGDARPLVRLADGRQGRMGLRNFLQYLADPNAFQTSTGPVYLTDFYVTPAFLEPRCSLLAPDAACPLPRGDRQFAEWITLYAGPPGTTTPMHQDVYGTHTWLAEIRGEKTWRLCAPDALDPDLDHDAFGDVDLGCDVFEAVLSPGDVIYLPPDWWHHVRNESSSTMALSGNFCTFEHARKSLEEALADSDASHRDRWATQWRTLIAQESVTSRPLGIAAFGG